MDDTKLKLHGLFTQVKNGPADQDVLPQQKKDNGKGESSPHLVASSADKDKDKDKDKGSALSVPLVPLAADSIFGSSPRTAIEKSRSTERGQLEAWRDCGSMSQEDAMRAFLCVLFSSAPYWKYEQFI